MRRKALYVLAVLVVASAVYFTQRNDSEQNSDQPRNPETSSAATDPAGELSPEPAPDLETAQEDDLSGQWNKALDATKDAIGKTADEAGQALTEAVDATADAFGRAKEATSEALSGAAGAAAEALGKASESLKTQKDKEGGGPGE